MYCSYYVCMFSMLMGSDIYKHVCGAMLLKVRRVLGSGHLSICPGRGAQFHAGCETSRPPQCPLVAG